MRSLLLISFLCSAFSLCAQNWVQSTDYPSNGVDDGTAFIIGNNAYCGTGVVDWYASQRDFYEFDLSTEQWKSIAFLPQGEERQYANGFASDSFGYVFGGYNDHFLNDLWRYDPGRNQWQAMTSLPDSGRGGAASFVIGDIAYIIGGKTDSLQAIRQVWAYDMNKDSWQQKNDLPFGNRWRSAATANDSMGFLAFGKDDTLRYCPEFYAYNPLTDSWTKMGNFPKGGRNYVKMHWMDGKLLVFGGEDSSSSFLNEFWSYDLQIGKWEALNPLPAKARRGGISFHSAGAIYYVSGLTQSNGRTKEAWKCVDPTSLEEHAWKPKLQLFPNPTRNNLIVSHPTLIAAEHWNYELINGKGQLLKKAKMHAWSTQISMDKLPQGVYFLIIRSEQGVVVKKVVKE